MALTEVAGVRDGKSKNARRNIPLTDRAASMLQTRMKGTSPLVFANGEGQRCLVTSVNHLHQKARKALGLSNDFVIHSLRHTMLIRLGESGVDAFTIMSGCRTQQHNGFPTLRASES